MNKNNDIQQPCTWKGAQYFFSQNRNDIYVPFWCLLAISLDLFARYSKNSPTQKISTFLQACSLPYEYKHVHVP